MRRRIGFANALNWSAPVNGRRFGYSLDISQSFEKTGTKSRDHKHCPARPRSTGSVSPSASTRDGSPKARRGTVSNEVRARRERAVSSQTGSTRVQLQRWWRFSAVSVMNVVVTQTLLLSFYRFTPMGAAWANVFAVGLSAIPAFVILRRWVWGRKRQLQRHAGNHSVLDLHLLRPGRQHRSRRRDRRTAVAIGSRRIGGQYRLLRSFVGDEVRAPRSMAVR